LFWKKSRARKWSFNPPTVSVIVASKSVVTTPLASRSRSVAPRWYSPRDARACTSARTSPSRALIASVAISHRGTSTISNLAPWRRNPIAISGIFPLSAFRFRAFEVRRDLRAVAELPRRADHRRHRENDARHVLQQFGDLPLLPPQLLGVREVLVLAAAATAEEHATRRHAMRRRAQHLEKIGLGEVFVVPVHPHPDRSPGSANGTITTQPFSFSIFDF
jgi:hypothetical protein